MGTVPVAPGALRLPMAGGVSKIQTIFVGLVLSQEHSTVGYGYTDLLKSNWNDWGKVQCHCPAHLWVGVGSGDGDKV